VLTSREPGVWGNSGTVPRRLFRAFRRRPTALRTHFEDLSSTPRRIDLGRLDELVLRLLDFGSHQIESLSDLKSQLHYIENAIVKAYGAGISISDMLALLDSEAGTRELLQHTPKLLLRDEGDAAYRSILDQIIETESKILRLPVS
jgi:hypothetical protein